MLARLPCDERVASYNAPVIRSAALALFCACLGPIVGACGRDEDLKPDRLSADDVRDDDPPADAGRARDTGPAEPGGFDVGESRVLESLRDPQTRQALCSALGIVVSGQTGSTSQTCESIADSCQSQPLPLGADAGLVLPEDLSAALQCPVTTAEVDRCLSDLMSAIGERDGGVSCTTGTDELLDPALLLGTVSCFPVFIKCPELVNALTQALQGSPESADAGGGSAAQVRSAR